jgi:pyridoxine 5'-phosphate synthase PdxJ
LPDLREISIGHGMTADALLPGLIEMARVLRQEARDQEKWVPVFRPITR